MTDYGAEARNVRDEPSASCYIVGEQESYQTFVVV